MMNSVVRILVAALWAVAWVLIDAAASYSNRVVAGRSGATAPGVLQTPSSSRFRSWLAMRLMSPPAAPRLIVA